MNKELYAISEFPVSYATTEIEYQSSLLFNSELCKEILDNMTEIAIVVNKNRQIIFSNQALVSLMGYDHLDDCRGLRPGEMIGCIYEKDTIEGCGTAKACKYCGMLNTILESQKTSEKVTKEIRITYKEGELEKNLDLLSQALTIQIQGQDFTLLSLTDISDKKRREILEKIFFHDVINKVGGLSGLIELLRLRIQDKEKIEISSQLVHLLYQSTQELVHEILAQKDLTLAENNELEIKPQYIQSLDMIANTVELLKGHDVSKDKNIAILPTAQAFTFVTDRIILGRVLENLIKNALEASDENMIVTTYCEEKEDTVAFIVYNESYIPAGIKLQIFQRFFSTKAKDRGLGTYSIKLLTERYLKGSVFFTSEESQGTSFHLILPKILQK